MQIPKETLARFEKAGYRIVGNHSGVSICHWTKESLRTGRVCYKEQWYSIKSHRCLEMSPSIAWCNHQCRFCWRPFECSACGEPGSDEPADIIDGCIEARKSLLTGFGGRDGTDRKKWEEAMKPTSAAISLAGEPTLYPRIGELIAEFNRRRMTSFLVTNGTMPDRLNSLSSEPTNLYVSLCAPDRETYLKVNRPLIKDGWERLNRTLEIMRSFNCRKVLRLTLVKGLNMHSVEEYARLVNKASPDIIEPKGYSWVGDSRERLGEENVPSMNEMRDFSSNLSELSGYRIEAENEPSKVLLLKR